MNVEDDGIYRVSQEECARLRENVPYVNTLRTGSFKLFKLFKRPFPGFLTILTL